MTDTPRVPPERALSFTLYADDEAVHHETVDVAEVDGGALAHQHADALYRVAVGLGARTWRVEVTDPEGVLSPFTFGGIVR